MPLCKKNLSLSFRADCVSTPPLPRQVSQLGDKLEQVDADSEVDAIMANIKETGIKYRELLQALNESADAAVRSAGPIRKSGASMIRCAPLAPLPDRLKGA